MRQITIPIQTTILTIQTAKFQSRKGLIGSELF
jgi:hypothetical protein